MKICFILFCFFTNQMCFAGIVISCLFNNEELECHDHNNDRDLLSSKKSLPNEVIHLTHSVRCNDLSSNSTLDHVDLESSNHSQKLPLSEFLIGELPFDILAQIVKRLDYSSFRNLKCISKKTSQLIEKSRLFKRMNIPSILFNRSVAHSVDLKVLGYYNDCPTKLNYEIFNSENKGHPFKLLKNSSHVIFSKLSLDNKKVLTSNINYELKIWDLKSGDCVFKLKGLNDTNVTGDLSVGYEILNASFSDDGLKLIINFLNDDVEVWDLNSRKKITTFKITNSYDFNKNFHSSFSHDGKKILTLISDYHGNEIVKKPVIKDSETGEDIQILNVPFSKNDRIFFLPDSLRVVIVSYKDSPILISESDFSSQEGSIEIWNIVSGTLLEKFYLKRYANDSIVLSSDGNSLGISGKNELKIYDLNFGKIIFSYDEPDAWGIKFSFSPSGKKVITYSCNDKFVKVWDIQSGQQITVFEADSCLIEYVSFSQDEAQVTIVSPRIVKIFDLRFL